MKIFSDIKSWQEERRIRALTETIGFIPTMGALHQGHLELVKRSQQENSYTIVSIFVNPTQFNDISDFDNYPQPLEDDISLLRNLSVQAVLCPTKDMLYPDNYRFQVQENQLSQLLCGQHREGHFTGVLTIVLKLLNVVNAHRAYFGEKDYQQLQLVTEMCRAFFIDTEIVPCPIVRESDGLAMSSRNRRLTVEHRKLAPLFHYYLRQNMSNNQIKGHLENNGFRVDYIETMMGRRLGAVSLGEIRLIDNVPFAGETGDSV